MLGLIGFILVNCESLAVRPNFFQKPKLFLTILVAKISAECTNLKQRNAQSTHPGAKAAFNPVPDGVVTVIFGTGPYPDETGGRGDEIKSTVDRERRRDHCPTGVVQVSRSAWVALGQIF